LAADAYTLAGERLAARRDVEPALDAFTKALALQPASHPALAGLLAAHTALGTADEAADILEDVAGERPDDLEVRAMLVRAYVEAENALRAEAAANEVVTRDPSSFTLYFEVIRLYLRQGNLDAATRLLGWVSDPALSGRQDAALTELLQEVLARDPEQLEAHRLLARAYSALHDDARLRSALERLAEAAESAGDREEERRAFTRLVRLEPQETGYRERLEELGGPLFDEDEKARRAAELPTFERFVMAGDAPASPSPEPGAPEGEAAQFEWNAVAETQPVDASASFADLNDLTDSVGRFDLAGQQQQQQSQDQQSGFQEFDFGAHEPVAEGARAQPDGAGVERMLRQELESVDFYIEKGYADIARDTLDMLERQYGPRAEIDACRQRLDVGAVAGISEGAAAGEEAAVDFTFVAAQPDAPTAPPAPVEQQQAGPQPPPAARPSQPREAAAPEAHAGIDAGLAAIFDEFREAIEDSDEGDGADFETRYQMGLAYREMGLLDQAVEEFQAAANMAAPGDGTPRYLRCCNMLGHCFMEKGMPRPAALWFKRGLAAPGHTEDEYQAMRYDLATAYEQLGDNDRAIEILSEVYAIDVSYRSVAERLRELQKTVNRGS